MEDLRFKIFVYVLRLFCVNNNGDGKILKRLFMSHKKLVKIHDSWALIE